MAARELDVPDWGMPKAEIERVQFLPLSELGLGSASSDAE